MVTPTTQPDPDIVDAIRAGASGSLVKDTDPSDLLAAVRAVARAVMRSSRLVSPLS